MKLSRLKERLSHGADVCQITQQKIVALENAPEDRKRLRQFPTVEAAMLLGVSESYLRQITKDGAEFTCGTVAGNNYRRTFTLKELHWILEVSTKRPVTSDTGDDAVHGRSYRLLPSPISRAARLRRRLPFISRNTWPCGAIAFWRSISTARLR